MTVRERVAYLNATVSALRAHAREHYADEDARWDVLDETYDSTEIVQLLDALGIDEGTPMTTVIREVGKHLNLEAERMEGFVEIRSWP